MSEAFVQGKVSRIECPRLGLSFAYKMQQLLNWIALTAVKWHVQNQPFSTSAFDFHPRNELTVPDFLLNVKF